MSAQTFDARPLVDPVDMAAVRAFRKEQQAKHPTSTSLAGIVIACVFGFFMLFMTFVVTIAIIAVGGWWGVLPPLFLVTAVIGIAVLISTKMRQAAVEGYRLSRFAAANGMEYVGDIDDPPLPGMIFRNGSSRSASLALRGRRPRFVEFGNYQYTTGSGKNRSTHHWGYIAVKLDVPLPNIVLDARGNNTLGSNLPASFAQEQRLSLEGDFDQYFTLYCPAGYERDALYLFTPDIMARFIDHAAELDVEIVDDWLFLYMQRPVSTVDPATWAWLFGTVGALMTKFDQWARWRDERMPAAPASAAPPAVAPGAPAPAAPALPFAPPVGMLTPPPGVAAPGRRLKRGVSWVSIVIIAAIAIAVLLPQLFPVLIALFLR